MNEQTLYQEIGQLLVNAGPADARKIIVRANIFSEGDGGEYEFDYIDNFGELGWFEPDGRAIGDLTELLVKLREYFLENNLTSGERAWNGCLISLDVGKMKIGIEFIYED